MKMKFKHNPNYADVEVLLTTCIWPNGEVPAWAEERALAWDCSPASSAITEAAMKFEIERLRAMLLKAGACGGKAVSWGYGGRESDCGICDFSCDPSDDGPSWICAVTLEHKVYPGYDGEMVESSRVGNYNMKGE